MPDVAPTLAVLAVFAEGTTTIRNVPSLHIKESDQLAALKCELTKLGAVVEETDDGLRIQPPIEPVPTAIDTYDDHRMAMSFALAGLRLPELTIKGIECTSKTWPNFFQQFHELTRKR